MKAVVLAAGRGTRLLPLTENKPKSMVEVNGKPIIRWILDSLKECKITDVIIITGYKCGTLKSYIKYNITDMDIQFIHQKKLTGTADAIYLVKDYIKEAFIVLAGDTIFSKNDIMKLRQLRNSILYVEKKDRLYDYGTLDISGNIIKYINEKSTNPTSNAVNCSAYHFTPSVFNFIPKTEVDERFGERIITNTINQMIKNNIYFQGIKIKYFNEISYPEDIEDVEYRLKNCL